MHIVAQAAPRAYYYMEVLPPNFRIVGEGEKAKSLAYGANQSDSLACGGTSA